MTKVDNWDAKQIKAGASFLQSLEWAKFQEANGLIYHTIDGPGWSCLFLIKDNRFGRYLFAPYGPTLSSPKYLADCLVELTSLARKVKADWLKIEPLTADGQTAQLVNDLAAHRAVRAVHNAEPSLTRVLDLSSPTDQLLAGISQSTRSLIRKTEREKILEFKTSTDPADMAGFVELLNGVANRRGVSFFPEKYFVKQAEILMPAKMMYLEQAYQGGQLVGAAVIHDFGPISSYTYAASLPEAAKLSVSAMLLWQAMKNAKARGSKTLDLYGTAPDNAPPSHPWYGFSAYKRKFGGQVIELAGTWDLPLTPKYRLYRGAQRLYRQWRRR